MDGAPGGQLHEDPLRQRPRPLVLTTGAADQLVAPSTAAPPRVGHPATARIFAAAFASPMRVVAAGDGGTHRGLRRRGHDVHADRLAPARHLPRASQAQSGRRPTRSARDGALARTTNGGETWANPLGSHRPGHRGHVVREPRDGLRARLDGARCSAPTTAEPAGASSTPAARPPTVSRAHRGPRGARGPTGIRLFDQRRRRVLHRAVERDPRARVSQADRVGPVCSCGRALPRGVGRREPLARLLRPRPLRDQARGLREPEGGLPARPNGRLWKTRTRVDLDRAAAVARHLAGPRHGVQRREVGLAHGQLVRRLNEHGLVLRTTDSGATWRPQLIGPQPSCRTASRPRATAASRWRTGGVRHRQGRRCRRCLHAPLRTRLRKLETPGVHQRDRERSRRRGRRARGWSLRREIGANCWAFQTVTAAANGSFTTRWRVRRTSWFVAQWIGDDDRAGDGSQPLRVHGPVAEAVAWRSRSRGPITCATAWTTRRWRRAFNRRSRSTRTSASRCGGGRRLRRRPPARRRAAAEPRRLAARGGLFSVAEAALGGAFVGAFAEYMAGITPLANPQRSHTSSWPRGRSPPPRSSAGDKSELLERLDLTAASSSPSRSRWPTSRAYKVAEVTVHWHVRKNAGMRLRAASLAATSR